MKTKLIIIICSLGLLAGCASQSSPATCVLLKFPHAPSQQVVEQLANTQPIEDHQRIVAHFANGQKTFILSGIHTNEIAAAVMALEASK